MFQLSGFRLRRGRITIFRLIKARVLSGTVVESDTLTAAKVTSFAFLQNLIPHALDVFDQFLGPRCPERKALCEPVVDVFV